MKGGGIMSEQFDAFKQAADKALTELRAVLMLSSNLLMNYSKPKQMILKTSFKLQEVDKLNAKISKLESRVAELNDQLSRHDK